MRYMLTAVLFFISTFVFAQIKNGIVSGPVQGQIEMRTADIWVEVTPDVKTVALKFNAAGADKKATGKESGLINYKGELGKEFNPIKFSIGGLKLNTTYNYSLLINGKEIRFPYETKFTTKDVWQWRKPAPDFSFLTGSCAYFNEPEFDRPGKPYGNDSSIFQTMANTPAAFMLWLGDNWYTRETDFHSEWGLWYRASRDRSLPVLQKFWASMPHYAIWDDHDYGPNNADKSFGLKKQARDVFKNYWCNPSFGLNENGIYTQLKYSDVDLFLLDDRWYRSNDAMKDSIDGKPNAEKSMWGKEQLEWLKNSLLRSQDESEKVKASFRVIVTGSQVLNTLSPVDCAYHYPADYNELLNFIRDNKIEGVIFLTGDRHHSEIIKQEREGDYTLYDITVSPLTAGLSKPSGREANHPDRIPNTLINAHNFGKISVSGKAGERILKVEFMGTNGDKLGEWSINQKELRNK